MTSQNRILTILLAVLSIASGNTQSDILITAAKGTGQTTGHIATISVKNKGDQSVTLSPQVFFIPSHHRFQSYVGRIPAGNRIPPGTVKDINIPGYCTDVHTPPVPAGKDMPPLSSWIPVDGAIAPSFGNNEQVAITSQPVARFETSQIAKIQSSPGFSRQNIDTDASTQPTWPGTNMPINGTIDLSQSPRNFAGLIVTIVESIEDAAERLINSNEVSTPFSADRNREKEALVQQTTWIVMAGLTEDEYTKADFAENVYNQYESQTGISTEELGEPQKDQIDKGVDDFWGAFQATGVEAKVLINQEGKQNDELGDKADGEGVTDKTENKASACICKDISFDYFPSGFEDKPGKAGNPVFKLPTQKSFGFAEPDTLTFNASKLANKFTFRISKVKIKCECEDGDCTYDETSLEISSEETVTENQNGAYAVSTETKGEKTISLTITGNCKSADCDPKACSKKIAIKITRPDDK